MALSQEKIRGARNVASALALARIVNSPIRYSTLPQTPIKYSKMILASNAYASDDSDLRNVAHIGTCLTAVGLAVGERTGANGQDVLTTMLNVESYSEFFIGPNASVIYGSVWASGWFVLLIACANLANLTLARTLGRSREFSIRIALGAGHWRMVRRILTESLLLAGASGALGWWIATWSVRTWAAATASRYQVLDYALDDGTLTYLIAISIATALLCAVAPIGCLLRFEVNGTLNRGARTATQGRRSKGLSTALVAGQMALAIVLLSGAGVVVRSLLTIVDAPTGVSDPEDVLIGSMALPSEKYRNSDTKLRYFDQLEVQLKAIPGIQDESLSNTIPVNSGIIRSFEIEGQNTPPGAGESAQFLTVGSDYFRVVRAPVISGRAFNDEDHDSTLPVAIVNESFAGRFWPNEQALGKRLRATDGNTRWRTVVGVVSNIMQGDPLRQHFQPLVYAPFRQDPGTHARNSDGCTRNLDLGRADRLPYPLASCRSRRSSGGLAAGLRKDERCG